MCGGAPGLTDEVKRTIPLTSWRATFAAPFQPVGVANLMSFSKILPLMLAAAPLAMAVPAWAQPVAPSGPAAGVTTQLPRGAAPSHYAIEVTPDAANLKFTGRTTIDVIVTQAMPALVLNAADLTISSVTLTPVNDKAAKGKAAKGTARIDAAAQTVTFDFGKPLQPGSYKLDIDYAGVINQQANGLFALDYTDNAGKAKRALFTQFEAPDARRFVPSFDEPSYKATFDLSAVVPADQLAVSNMPVKSSADAGSGRKLVTFGTSPKMSSYLLFFGLGELERATKMAGATEVGVITGKGNTGKAQLALDASAAILPYYNDYFGVPFPLPKLDNVAGPGQSQFFSAMENWGAIFTFERALLVDPRFTSESTRRTIYSIVAHEMAHQWFGDLVTMAWWDDLWLNEGFASWMATKVTDKLNPEWEMLLSRVNGRERAMSLDSLVTTHPILQKIHTVDEVNQAFDDITYEKGEAVITMLEGFAGEDAWRSGIRAYMKQHAYGNTVTDDLWKAVEGAGAKGVVGIAHDFTSQPGIPLVKVDSAQCQGGSTILSLSQGEFSRDRKDKAPLKWNVPVMAQAIGPRGRRDAAAPDPERIGAGDAAGLWRLSDQRRADGLLPLALSGSESQIPGQGLHQIDVDGPDRPDGGQFPAGPRRLSAHGTGTRPDRCGARDRQPRRAGGGAGLSRQCPHHAGERQGEPGAGRGLCVEEAEPGAGKRRIRCQAGRESPGAGVALGPGVDAGRHGRQGGGRGSEQAFRRAGDQSVRA